jgi:hypothetical protein
MGDWLIYLLENIISKSATKIDRLMTTRQEFEEAERRELRSLQPYTLCSRWEVDDAGPG